MTKRATRPEDRSRLVLERLSGDRPPSAILPTEVVTAEVARWQPDRTWLWVLDQPGILPELAG